MPADEKSEPLVFHGPEPGSEMRSVLIGCGGTGCNLIAESGVKKAHLKVAISSELDVLNGLKDVEKILVDSRRVQKDAVNLARVTRLAGTETEKELGGHLNGADLAFIVAGLGGYTGGWSAVLAARATQRHRCTSICVVSEPFGVEGRKEIVGEQLRTLMDYADGVLVLPNDMIISEAPNLPIAKAFQVLNSILASPINLILESVGKEDMKILGSCLKASKIFSMDVAEWEGENATFSVVEQLSKSKWLALEGRTVKSAILLVEGYLLYDDLVQLGKEFSRAVSKDAILVLGSAGSAENALRVTAIVGF